MDAQETGSPPFRSFWNRHQGQTAWVFGKGQSLDAFDFSAAGPLRVCVNETAVVVPEPTYFFAHDEDPIDWLAKAWPPNCIAFLQHVRAEYAIRRGIPGDQIVMYEKLQGVPGVLDLPPAAVAERGILYGHSSSAHSALHFCHLAGVEAVVLVGFDGQGSAARILPYEQGPCSLHAGIRQHIFEMLDTLHIRHSEFKP